MIKLYGMTLSAHTRKVQSALIELGLPYELIVIDLMTGAQHSPDYLALNPGAKTPTLVDGDLAIWDTLAIAEWMRPHSPSHTPMRRYRSRFWTEYWQSNRTLAAAAFPSPTLQWQSRSFCRSGAEWISVSTLTSAAGSPQ